MEQEVLLLCPECFKITEGIGNEIDLSRDIITCKSCGKQFVAGCSSKIPKKIDYSLLNKNEKRKLYIPYDFGKYLHDNHKE